MPTVSQVLIRPAGSAPGSSVDPIELQVGQTRKLDAMVRYSDGTEERAMSARWATDDPDVATVTPDGELTGQHRGDTRVSASVDVGVAHMNVGVSWPVDPQFDDQYWRELVFDGHEEPNDVAAAVTRVLETTSPNFYIRLDNPGWPDWPSDSLVSRMREAIPGLAEQLTGQPYRGRIETGDADRPGAPGYIVVVFEQQNRACGRARLGADPGRIWMSPPCFSLFDENAFLTVFAHEVGHAFGFHHVSDHRAVMLNAAPGYGPGFTAPEQYHAQLAYEIGRGQPYAGWPFSRKFGPTNVGTDWPTMPLPVIVVDD